MLKIKSMMEKRSHYSPYGRFENFGNIRLYILACAVLGETLEEKYSNIEANFDLIEWKRRGFLLHYAEYLLEHYYESGKISKRERNKIKKFIDQRWLDIWHYHPDNNPSLEELFKLNFL